MTGPTKRMTALVLAVASATMAQSPAPTVLAWQEVIDDQRDHSVRWPVAVATGDDRELCVADTFGARLVIFRDDGGGEGWRSQRSIELPAPAYGLAWSGGRYVVSLREGRGLFSLEGEDLALRALAVPEDTVTGLIAGWSEGGLLVQDLAGERVLRLDNAGALRQETAVDGEITGLAALPGGGFLAAFAGPGEVRKYAADGRIAGTWQVPAAVPVPAWPVGMVAEPDGGAILCDRHAGRLVVLAGDGTLIGFGSRQGWDPGLLLRPSAVARFPDGRIAVADQGNGRVQIFRRIATGRP